jgi:dihydrofolate reductase
LKNNIINKLFTVHISIIVATSKNNVIGIKNQLPWHLPADLKYFKSLTNGHSIIMGRKTYDSIGRPLPNRENIIITRDESFSSTELVVTHSIEEAIQHCHGQEEVFIIGGDTIYKQTLSIATKLYITRVDTLIEEGDAFFPEINVAEWKKVSDEHFEKDEKNKFHYSFEVYERIAKQ